MAGLEIPSFKLSFLLVSKLVMLSLIVVAAEDVVPLPPLPSTTHDYLEHCGTNLRPKCGEEIRVAVFENGKVSDGCCKDLLAEGWACHHKFVEVATPYYPELARSEAWGNAVLVWKSCEPFA